MKRLFVETERFRKEWINSGLDGDDFKNFQNFLLHRPDSGDVLVGCGGIRKIRWKKAGMGKSGGVRIFYLDLTSYEVIYLLAVIEKSEGENLSKAERNILKSWADKIKEKHRDKTI